MNASVEPVAMRVAYRPSSGPEWNLSTAFLDTEHQDGTYSGTDKYTDDPVTVRWAGSAWVEVVE